MRVLVLLVVLAAGCGEEDGYDPCAGLDCGEECQLCDPMDPECVETDVLKSCNLDGVCSAAPVTCPTAQEP